MLIDIMPHYDRCNSLLINFCNFGHCNLEFVCNLGFGICDFLHLRVLRGFVVKNLSFICG
jgi:hypothetical protein